MRISFVEKAIISIMDQLRALKYFVAVAKHNSFSKAALEFNVPASSLSRRIADLELSLGASLFKRSTRQVKLTEVGRNYFEQIKPILNQLTQTNESVKTYQSEPMGQLKINATMGFGEQKLIPILDEFSKLFPKIVLDITLSDAVSSLEHDDVDIAIRGGYAPNERVVAIKLQDNQFYAVAAKSYLDQADTPKTPLELKTHKGIFFRSPNGPIPWLSFVDDQWIDVSGQAVLVSNHGGLILQKVLQGDGICMLPKWAIAEYLENKELIELDIQPQVVSSTKTDSNIFLLYSKHRYLEPKIKVAVNFIIEKLKDS